MGTNVAGCAGEILGDGENVLRGLNPAYCEAGLSTEGCFIFRRNDPVDDGPSHGILESPPENAAACPLGAAQGIAPAIFAALLPKPDYGVAQLNVGRALREVRGRVFFVQKDADDWGDYRRAHAMVTGHQNLENRTLKDLRRYLTRIAAEGVLKAPEPKIW